MSPGNTYDWFESNCVAIARDGEGWRFEFDDGSSTTVTGRDFVLGNEYPNEFLMGQNPPDTVEAMLERRKKKKEEEKQKERTRRAIYVADREEYVKASIDRLVEWGHGIRMDILAKRDGALLVGIRGELITMFDAGFEKGKNPLRNITDEVNHEQNKDGEKK